MPNLNEIVFKKVCRTCLSCSQDMKSLYGASSSSTPITFAEMLMTFTSLKFFGYDGLPRHICYNCIEDLHRSYTFQLKCTESDTLLRKDIEKDVLPIERIITEPILGDPHFTIKINQPIRQVEIIENSLPHNKSLNKITECLLIDNNSKGKCFINTYNSNDNKIDMNKTNIAIESSQTNQNNNLTNDVLPPKKRMCLQSNKLMTPIRNHTKVRPFACSVCGSSFVKNRSLVHHHMLAHAPENIIKEHTSIQCSNIIPATLHTGTAETQKNLHQDSNQSKSFNQKKLTNYIPPSKKRFSCLFCPKFFAQNNQLLAHIRHHTGVNTFDCRDCRRQFRRYRDLDYHNKQSHTPEQPLIRTKFEDNSIKAHTKLQCNKINNCLIIEDNSNTKHNIGTHNSHDSTIEINKTLDIPSGSSQTNSRSLNQNNYTGVKSFVCTSCNNSFTKYRTLVRHYKRVHCQEMRTNFEENPITELDRLQCSNIVPATLHKIPVLIAETQKDLCQEEFVNHDIDVNIEMRENMESNNDRSCDIIKQIYVLENPFNASLTSEMQNDLHQELGLINPEVDNDATMITPSMNQVEIIQNSVTNSKSYNIINDCLMVDDNSNTKYNIGIDNSHDSKIEMNKMLDFPSGSSQTNRGPLNENNNLMTDVLPSKEMFSCLVCQKSFAQRYSLTAHLRSHSGLNRFPCTICNWIYPRYRGLIRHHKRRHDPEYLKFRTKFEGNPIKEHTKVQCSYIVPTKLHNIPVLIAETQKDLHQESQLVNHDIDVDVNIKTEDDIESNNDRSCDIMKQIYVPEKPLNIPLIFSEMQKDLKPELDLIKYEVEFDVKIKIEDVEIRPQ